MSRSKELEQHLHRADELCRTIGRCEHALDHLLSMRKLDPELPDNFFRSDSIVPPSSKQPRASVPLDPDALAVAIGQRIRDLRENRSWTQQDLADRTDIRRPNIARLERGSGLPNLSTLLKVADGLEVAINELITAD